MVANVFSQFTADVFHRLFGTGELRDVFAHVMPANRYEWAIMFFFVGIVAAVAEEFIFRDFLLKPLRRFGDRQAVIITAVLFGAFHGNATQFLYATVAGVILAIVTVKSNSLKPAIILHMANNLFNLGLAVMQTSSEPRIADLSPTVVLFTLIAGVVATAVLLVTKRLAVTSESPIPAKLSAKSALSSPAVIVLAAILILSIVRGS
jgi:membrane protease YdiL (CAAX protease family)